MLSDLFKTTPLQATPLDGSLRNPPAGATSVSDFVTVQSFANFATMTGEIGAAWKGLEPFGGWFTKPWVPYILAGVFALLSVAISLEGLKKPGSQELDRGKVAVAVFIAVINGPVLASAVVGTGIVEPSPEPVG